MAEPSASDSAGTDSDQEFDPSAEMLVNDFDDEHTLDEEEAIAEEDAKEEIDELTKEGNMPIEELLAMYGYGGSNNQEKDSKSEEAGDEKVGGGSDSSNQSSSQQSTSQQPSTTNNRNASTSRAAAATASLVNSNMSDYSDSESDEDFSANEDEWRRTIQVGSDFQATIPEGLSKYENETENEDEKPYISTRQGENRDILLWKPTTALDDDQLDEFVRTYDGMYDDETVLPSGEHNRDDDHALYLLFTCRYNLAEALQRHENNPNPSADSTPVRKMMDPWTEEECRSFEAGLRAYGKDFFQIKHNKIATRTVGEVITFYYFWKKTERHDQFVAKYRVEKKKYALHPGTTDYMDRFLDEQENMMMNSVPNNATGLASTNSMTSSHNSNSLIHSSSTTSLHHHLNLNHLTSSPSGRQSSSSGLGQLNNSSSSAQSSSRHHHHHHHSSSSSHHHDSYSGNSVTISGPNMRTINVSATGEPQTILINDADFNGSNQTLSRTLGQLFAAQLGNFTRTTQQVAACYADRLEGRPLNIFNASLSVREVVSHYYNAFPKKQITARSIASLLHSTKHIIATCLDPNRANPRAIFGFTFLSDLTQEELKRIQAIPSGTHSNSTATTTNNKRQVDNTEDHFNRPECSASGVIVIPERFDWRDYGVVTSVKHQRCASCYIFAGVAAIESAMLVHRKTTRTAQTLNLSEDMLEDCTSTGCDGGFAEDVFDYVLKNGISYQDQYQSRRRRYGWFGYYEGDQQRCNANFTSRIYPLRGYCVKTYRNEVGSRIIPDTVIQQHLLKFGPLYVATSTYFYDLVGGIVDDPDCTDRGYLNHAVLMVGYDEDTWIIKNSFTEDYGEKGYYRIARHNRNICGINTEIAFPLV